MSFVRLPRFARTTTFKLALLQAALFAVSASALFIAVYWGVVNYATAQIRSSVETESAVLVEESVSDGIAELITSLELRTKDRKAEGRTYLLRGADGARLAGKLQAQVEPGWQMVDRPDHAGVADHAPRHSLMVFGQTLSGGQVLFVGQDMRDVGAISSLLIRTFAWAAGLTVVLAMLGGLITSIAALRRVEIINATARRIMNGDLGQRIAVRGTQDEFDRLAVNLNLMLDRIERLMDGVRQVSNDIAHDLRTPLTHLRQRLDAARVGEQSISAYQAVLDATASDADRILRIFAALLRIAQIESGTRRGAFVDLDLSDIFASMLDIYAPVAEDAGQRMTGTFDTNVRVAGDVELLTQMLANLVENAIRYAGPGAWIELTLRGGESGVRGIVADTGPGIPAEAYEKVFRRFYRLAGDRGAEGHGLGLSLVKAVVDLHGARVTLEHNRPGLRVTLDFGPDRAATPSKTSSDRLSSQANG